ncbi:hypothetical protein Dimus_038495 [Dionaea muscipula]
MFHQTNIHLLAVGSSVGASPVACSEFDHSGNILKGSEDPSLFSHGSSGGATGFPSSTRSNFVVGMGTRLLIAIARASLVARDSLSLTIYAACALHKLKPFLKCGKQRGIAAWRKPLEFINSLIARFLECANCFGRSSTKVFLRRRRESAAASTRIFSILEICCASPISLINFDTSLCRMSLEDFIVSS